MTVKDVQKDLVSKTMTITSEFDAPVDRVWQMWADPRKLERWWGPPTHPATFVRHDLTPGTIITYFMTAPDGETPHGWWRVTAVDVPRQLEFEIGFGDHPDHAPDDLPGKIRVTLSDVSAARTRMVIETTFPSPEAMEETLAMGMEEGMTAALGQIDDILREDGA